MIQSIKDLTKKNLGKILLALELVILLAAAGRYAYKVNHLVYLHYSEDQLRAFDQTESDACFGGTITEERGSGLYDVIPDMPLKKGYYRYMVSYENSSEESFCWPHSYVEFYNLMDDAVTYFEQGSHTRRDEFWLNVDLDVALRLYYDGTGEVSFKEFTIEETSAAANRSLLSVILLCGLADCVYYLKKRDRRKPFEVSSKYVFFALLGIGLVSSYPLFLNYAINGHDFLFHLTRIDGLAQALRSGQFPVRINPAFYNGYGYANPIFYGEALLYFPAFLRIIGFKLTSCYNIYAVFVNMLTTFVAYYSFKKLLKEQTLAVCCTLFYVLAPYRMMDLYLRAAVGEYSAMIFLPLVIWGMYRIYQEDVTSPEYKWSFLPLTVGLTGIIQTHVLTGEMTGGVILLTCVLLVKKTLEKKRFWALLKTVLVTVLVNAWFLVPFVDFSLTQDVRALRAPARDMIQKTGAYITQLFGLFSEYVWANQDAGAGIGSEMPLNLGLPLAMGLFLFAAMYFCTQKKQKERVHGLVFFALSVMTLWMATIYFPWDRIATTFPVLLTLISSIQYTWRFLTLATALAAACTGYGLFLLRGEKGKTYYAIAATTLGILTGVSAMYFMQECLQNQGPVVMNSIEDLTGMDTATTATGGEYVLSSANHDVVTGIFEPRCYGGVWAEEYSKDGTNITVTVNNDGTDGYLLLPLLNYKGYRVSSEDGVINNTCLVTGENAVLQINIPANYAGTIRVKYVGMWYWRVAEILSVVTVAGILYLYFCKRKKTLNHENDV